MCDGWGVCLCRSQIGRAIGEYSACCHSYYHIKRRLLTLRSDVMELRNFHLYTELSSDECLRDVSTLYQSHGDTGVSSIE